MELNLMVHSSQGRRDPLPLPLPGGPPGGDDPAGVGVDGEPRTGSSTGGRPRAASSRSSPFSSAPGTFVT